MFRVGDIVVGLPDASYTITGPKSVNRVTRIIDNETMHVDCIKGAPDAVPIDNSFCVEMKAFKLATNGVCRYCDQLLPEKPIVVNGTNVVFEKDGIKVGCTTVSSKTVEEIYKRLQEGN